ncbi:hypothetical protein D3C87_1315310 [compost metagenome]
MSEVVYLENIQFSVMFCNDVRFERDGQVTYVGVYQPHLTVKEFPYTFRNFSAVLTLLAPAEVGTEKIGFRVFRNDKVVMDFAPTLAEMPSTERNMRVSVNMQTEAFEITEPSKFHAEVMVGDKVYRSRNTLNVTTQPFAGWTVDGKETKPRFDEPF